MGLKRDKDKDKEKGKKEKALENEALAESQAAADQDAGEEQGAQTAPEEEAIPMVMLPAEDVERLKAEAKVNLENWQRERADFVNYKKRIERDQQQLRSQITGDILKKILPALDDMERALKAMPESGQEASWAQGIDLIYRKLRNIIEAEGVTRITAEEFDPNIHEAISHEASPDHESGAIIEIVQQGYKLGDRVLRPALVRVAQ